MSYWPMFCLGMKKGANLSFVPLISCGGVWNTNDTNKWEKIHAIA